MTRSCELHAFPRVCGNCSYHDIPFAHEIAGSCKISAGQATMRACGGKKRWVGAQRLRSRGMFVAKYSSPRQSRSNDMPRGDKSSYTGKQKRQAEHIEDSYKKRGVSSKTAAKRAWATVNKETGGGKKGGAKKKTAKKAAKKSRGRKKTASKKK